jgi:hypothetical protein
MSIKNRIVFKGKLKDYPGAEALTEVLSSTTMVTGNTITGHTATVGLNTDRGKGVTICKAKDCNNTLYGWTSSKNKEYCVDCL